LEVQNGIKIKMERAAISKELSVQYLKTEDKKADKKIASNKESKEDADEK